MSKGEKLKLWAKQHPKQLKKYYKKYYAKNKSDPAFRAMKNESARWARRKAKYGITRDQYEALLDEQNGRCKICGGNFGYDLRVDHNHGTGEVRGLLCANCNSGIGYLKDDPEIMKSAIQYLSNMRLSS